MTRFSSGAGSRAITRQIQRCVTLWQSQGRHCGHATSELWQLHLPLMTMVGLTLIGLYDCKAVTLAGNAESTAPVPAFEQVAETAPVQNAVTVPARANRSESDSVVVKNTTVPVSQTDGSPDAGSNLLFKRVRLSSVNRSVRDRSSSAQGQPQSRPFALALQDVLAGLSATAPPVL